MEHLHEIVDRYTAVWNEPDNDARGKAVADLWAEDAVHTITTTVYRGRTAILERVEEAHRQFVTTAGFVFQCHAPAGHHNAVILRWEMVPAGGGAAAAAGSAFLLLDNEGRISADYQFTDG